MLMGQPVPSRFDPCIALKLLFLNRTPFHLLPICSARPFCHLYCLVEFLFLLRYLQHLSLDSPHGLKKASGYLENV